MARLWLIGAGLLVAGLAAPAVHADTEPTNQQLQDMLLARDDELTEVKRQLGVVVDELSGLKTQMGVPEERPLEGQYGYGPAAAKIFGAARGVSIGGYAEAVYRNEIADAGASGRADSADFVRLVMYFGYKFTDNLVFNSEIEFEHTSTGEEGEVSVEFASLDYLLRPELNVRGGLLLVPMGFLNEVHEPPFYFGTQRPEVERRIIPSTWRENGVGIFGDWGERVSYRVYVVNGLDASGFDSFGLRGGRQDGSKAKAEDLALVGRLDIQLCPEVLVGGSFYTGNSGQDQTLSMTGLALPDSRTTIWEVHVDVAKGPLRMRGLFAHANVDNAARLSQALSAEATAVAGSTKTVVVADQMLGGYAEIGYDILAWLFPDSEKELSPFFRFEYLDTQHEVPTGFARDTTKPRRLFIPGIHFKPHPNVVIKIDYRNIDPFSGKDADEISVGMGLAF